MTARFWIAHARGCDFAKLREKGFVTLYPSIDDYVFLEASDKNLRLLRKQTELGVYFLRKGGEYVTVPQKEIDRMFEKTVDRIGKGAEILVVSGFGANLTGTVTEAEENRLRCELQGFNRTYDVWIDRLDVVIKPEEEVELDGQDPDN